MDEFNTWKNIYVVECTYNKDEVEHFGMCEKPSRFIRRNYTFKRKFEFTYDLLKHIDKYSNVIINDEVKNKFLVKDSYCNLLNKECIHKSKYTLVHVEIIENPLHIIKTRLIKETNFSSISEFEEAIRLGKRSKEELIEHKKKLEEEKVKRLSSLFVKGRI
jgi:hypothetical protein